LVRWSGIRFPLWVALILVAPTAFAQSIQYAEPVSLALTAHSAEFDAYGRRFSLTLTDNARLLANLSAQRKAELSSYRLLRGAVNGATGSWVRLTQSATGIDGAIWDGHDLYAVTRYSRIADKLMSPLAVSADATVVYRLSDVRDTLPKNFCELGGVVQKANSTGLDDYRALIGELNSGVVTTPVDKQLEIALIGDTAFQQAESADPTAALLARFNIVEGIFSSQVGVLLMATDVRLMPASSDPFTATKASTLLDQVSAFRTATPAVKARGLAHLVTGKDLDGTTAGIAYVGTLCDAKMGVSLSQQSYGTTISALIMAHELGHNFGASHDGEAGTACASTGGGFIMAPSVSGYATFSQCSLDSMRPVIAKAACITAADFADASLEASGDTVTGEAGQPFTAPFTLRSIGTRAVADATVTLTLPSSTGLSLESAAASTGSCEVSGLVATCPLGTIEPGSSVTVSVTGRATGAASFVVQGKVAASDDAVTSNDSRVVAVSLRSGVDATVALSANAQSVAVGAGVEIYADVRGLRSQPVKNAQLTFTLSQAVQSAAMPGATCTTNAFSVNCTVAEIAVGTTRRLTVMSQPAAAGSLFAGASVTATGDGDLSNNSSSASVWVQAARDVDVLASSAAIDLGVGVVQELAFAVSGRGPVATANSTLRFTLPASLAVDSFDGAACALVDPQIWECDLGAIAPGSQRVVRLRVHGTTPATGDVVAFVAVADDEYGVNNTAKVTLRVDHLVDLGVTMGAGGSGIEDSPLDGQVMLRSSGRQAAAGATLDIELNAMGVLRAVSIHNGAACALVSDTRARCTLPTMARNSTLYIDFTAQFAEPGFYDVTFTASAPNDTAPDNDKLTRAIIVRPYNDVAVTGSFDLDPVIAGATVERTFTVTTDRRGLAAAKFLAPHYLPGLRVDAIRADAGDCQITDTGGQCDFVDLPAFASVPVTVTYKAVEGTNEYDVTASVVTVDDVVAANDVVRGHATVQAPTDVELRAGANVSGSSQSTLDLPSIALVNGAEKAFSARLEVTLPPEVSLVGISAANSMCSGTVTLICDFPELDANSTTSIDIRVVANKPGTYTATLKFSASNDTNAANDVRDVTFQIGGTTPTATATAKSSGGGSMDWLGLALMGTFLISRYSRRTRRACRPVTMTAR
jgi:hypothetical protein